MTPTIYLVRHGETEWNRDDRMQGQQDSLLTAQGRKQAKRAGQALARMGLANLPTWISPLGRAVATAALIAEEVELGPVALEPRIREVGLGSWEGWTGDEIASRHGKDLTGIPRMAWGFHSPDGEGFEAAALRVRQWLGERREKTLVVITHGMIGRVFRSLLADVPPEISMVSNVPQNAIWRLSQGSLTELPVDGAPKENDR
nr:histidine phosphatase family protein [uncultured Cohaesibacter sp.]